MRKYEEEHGAKLIRSVGSILLGGILALLVCLVFLFLCSVIISKGWLNEGYMVRYTIAGCVLGCLFGGFYSVRKIRTRTLLVGLCVGCVMFLLLLTVGLLFYPGMSIETRGIGLLCACLVGGAMAGFAGGKPKKKRRK